MLAVEYPGNCGGREWNEWAWFCYIQQIIFLGFQLLLTMALEVTVEM